MSVREPLKIRKALLAGVVALALTGTGVAIAWSATDSPSPSPSPSESAPGKQDRKQDKAQRPQHLHSESVVKKADGTFETDPEPARHRGRRQRNLGHREKRGRLHAELRSQCGHQNHQVPCSCR